MPFETFFKSIFSIDPVHLFLGCLASPTAEEVTEAAVMVVATADTEEDTVVTEAGVTAAGVTAAEDTVEGTEAAMADTAEATVDTAEATECRLT